MRKKQRRSRHIVPVSNRPLDYRAIDIDVGICKGGLSIYRDA